LREEFAVFRSSRFTAWLLSAASLTALASGCNMTPKSASSAALKRQAETPAAVGSTAGSPELSTSNKLNNPVKVHLAYALWHEQEANLVEARNSYDKVLAISPKNVDAMLGLARLDIALGRMDDAEKRLFKAQKIAPKSAQVAVSLGQYYSARGDWTRALEQMKSARQLSPYDPAFAYHLGYAQAMSGDMTSALANFTEAVGAAEAQYNLAYILHEQGNLVAAEEHLQKAVSLKPELTQAQTLLVTVRQERHGNKAQMAGPTRTPSASSQHVEPASYTETMQTSVFDPAPAR
jgi:tetratricopeptide (TPR) repeat protein